MSFLSKLERKFGKYAIQNLSLMLILCYGFGYAIQAVNLPFLQYLTLNPCLILKGQIWRLFTWIIVPPAMFNIFTLLMLYFYYSLGTSLERTWGAFRYNLYLFSGMLFTIAGSFILLAYFVFMGMPLSSPELEIGMATYSFYFSTYYVNMSIFLAFAMTFPDMQVLLFFIVPIKIKWMGIVYAVYLIYSVFTGGIGTRIIIGASLLNFVLFFIENRARHHVPVRVRKRQYQFRAETERAQKPARHRCTICGATGDNSGLEFRYCSKCSGSHEYCSEHLFTHEHIK